MTANHYWYLKMSNSLKEVYEAKSNPEHVRKKPKTKTMEDLLYSDDSSNLSEFDQYMQEFVDRKNGSMAVVEGKRFSISQFGQTR